MLESFKKEEKTMPRGKTWSKEEIQLLYELQRTIGSIYHRKSLLGLTVSRKENKI